MKRYPILLVLLLVVIVNSMGQTPELINNPQFRPDAKAAVDSIYNFKFEAADVHLVRWKQRYPDHPLWQLMEGIELWWKVLSDLEDTSYDERFINTMKQVDYQAGKLLHKHPGSADGLIVRAISNGYLARHHANRGNWLQSMNYGRVAMKAHSYLKQHHPDLSDLKLAQGLKLYYTAYLPEAYPIVKTVSWALPSGDKKKGLKLIREAAEQAVFARAEATYFLGNINYNYEKEFDAAVRRFEELYRTYPNNNYYARILVKSYYKQKRHKKAYQVIEEILGRWEKYDLPHFKVIKEELLTWKGRILERQDNYDKAFQSYKLAFDMSLSLPNSNNRSYFVASGYGAGKLLYKQNKLTDAKLYLRKVTQADIDNGYRKRAEELLEKIKD